MEPEHRDDLLLRIIHEFSGRLPPETGAQLAQLVNAGEPGTALENLCEQLYELDVPVSRPAAASIRAIGTGMSLSPSYWKRLRLA